jgi:hypothetical protein
MMMGPQKKRVQRLTLIKIIKTMALIMMKMVSLW